MSNLRRKCNRSFLLLITAIFFALPSFAQQKDMQLWKGLVLQKSILKGKLQFSLNEEVRLVGNISEVGNAFTDVSAHYKFIKSLSLGGGYRYMVKQEVNEHRIYTDLSWRPQFESRLKVTLRTRLQYDTHPLESETLLRPRLNLSYNIKDFKASPFAGVEPFFGMWGGAITMNQLRMTAGVTYPIRKKVDLRAAWVLDLDTEVQQGDQDHAIVVRITVDLDKDDDKNDTQIGL